VGGIRGYYCSWIYVLNICIILCWFCVSSSRLSTKTRYSGVSLFDILLHAKLLWWYIRFTGMVFQNCYSKLDSTNANGGFGCSNFHYHHCNKHCFNGNRFPCLYETG